MFFMCFPSHLFFFMVASTSITGVASVTAMGMCDTRQNPLYMKGWTTVNRMVCSTISTYTSTLSDNMFPSLDSVAFLTQLLSLNVKVPLRALQDSVTFIQITDDNTSISAEQLGDLGSRQIMHLFPCVYASK